jgi:hypothetical protein
MTTKTVFEIRVYAHPRTTPVRTYECCSESCRIATMDYESIPLESNRRAEWPRSIAAMFCDREIPAEYRRECFMCEDEF